LLGFSRFLDGVMTNDETPRHLAEAFLAGRFDIRGKEEETDTSRL
jgi:pyruvate, water dikinase